MQYNKYSNTTWYSKCFEAEDHMLFLTRGHIKLAPHFK